MGKQRVRRLSAEHRPHGFRVVELAKARSAIAAPEIEPIRQTAHVQSRNAFRRNDVPDVVFKAGQFDPVVFQKIGQNGLRRKPIEIAAACRQIDLCFHERASMHFRLEIKKPFTDRVKD
jgi:hypothetical protein